MGEIQHQTVKKNPKTNQPKKKPQKKPNQRGFKSKEKILMKKRGNVAASLICQDIQLHILYIQYVHIHTVHTVYILYSSTTFLFYLTKLHLFLELSGFFIPHRLCNKPCKMPGAGIGRKRTLIKKMFILGSRHLFKTEYLCKSAEVHFQ